MPTISEMFGTLTDWHLWNGADHRVREFDATGRQAIADEYRELRDQYSVDPLQVLVATYEVVESLIAGRWDAITEARLQGVTWVQIGGALRRDADEVRKEYTVMIDWIAKTQPDHGDLDRYRIALSS